MGITNEAAWQRGETAVGREVWESEQEWWWRHFVREKFPFVTHSMWMSSVFSPFGSSFRWILFSPSICFLRLTTIICRHRTLEKKFELKFWKQQEAKWRHCSKKRKIRFHQTRIQITLARKSITENLYLMSGDYSYKMCIRSHFPWSSKYLRPKANGI